MATKNPASAGDAPSKKIKDDNTRDKYKPKQKEPEPEIVPKTASEIEREQAEARAARRKQRFIQRWPEVTKVVFRTRKWRPPHPPTRLPKLTIDLPELTTRRWVPPYKRRKKVRSKLTRIPADEMTKPLYEYAKLTKIWHSFHQVGDNKMMLQGHVGCNSKRYSSTACGSQTGAIAVMCRALLEEKSASQLQRRDVDDLIEQGDKYYRQCMLALKCYKGKPTLQLNQLLTSFYFHDTKYTVKMNETDRGLLAKHPDNIQAEPDLMSLMEKKAGSTYTAILTVGDKNFLIWGHPPTDGAGKVKTICYIFDPHMLNDIGQPHKLYGGAGFLRYAGVSSFVLDLLANYGDLSAAKRGTPKPPIALTEIDIVQKETLLRQPRYEIDLRALPAHCKSEWESLNYNALIEKKQEGKVDGALSMISLATTRATSKKKVKEFYQKLPKEVPPQLPVPPERAPGWPTKEQVMSMRGEDFFLYCPRTDVHGFGRDDLLPRAKSEAVIHSPVEISKLNFHSQYHQIDVQMSILRATRHFSSQRYQAYKYNTGLACCVAALAMLRRYRARGWNEDILDESMDVGANLYRDSLLERGGPVRRLVLGELKDNFRIRDTSYAHKLRSVAVWGKLISGSPKVLDLYRGMDAFFKESDGGILQIPGEYEVAIWHEDGKYYGFHPWPADRYGNKVGLREGGKACLLAFDTIGRFCDHFLQNAGEMKRKPYTISDVAVSEMRDLPEPVYQFKSVAPNQWVISGRFHEGDSRFPPDHRNKQATPAAITAIAISHVRHPSEWTADDVDEALIRGDILYQQTMEALESGGGESDEPTAKDEQSPEEETEERVCGGLAAADVLNKFKVSDYDCIETEILDSAYSGSLHPEPDSGLVSLKESLRQMFKEHSHAVVTARGGSMGVWRHEDHFYFFDSHACDENGYPSDEVRAAACLVRLKGDVDDLAGLIESHLAPGSDDSFNISPVEVTATKLDQLSGAPETKVESKAFEWIRPGTAAIMMGPRAENTALGKAAEKAGVPVWDYGHPTNGNAAMKQGTDKDDLAGRTIALPAAAAFTASAAAVPPPHMHQDHMFNFLDAGADYYLKHVKKTGRQEITPEDLNEKFEMGANTFLIVLDEPLRAPLRLPDKNMGGDVYTNSPSMVDPLQGTGLLQYTMWDRTEIRPQVPALVQCGLETVNDRHHLFGDNDRDQRINVLSEQEGGEEEGAEAEEMGEEEEPQVEKIKEIRQALYKVMSKPNSVALLVGPYHQIGVWCDAGGKTVAFDPAPTLPKGILTSHRVTKGDEIRMQMLKDEMTGEGAGEADEEGGDEEEAPNEEKIMEPEFVPPESCPALMVFSSPTEFIDKLVQQGGLNAKQCLVPYKLYPVRVINELTSVLKEKKGGGKMISDEAPAGGDDDDEGADAGDEQVTALEDAALGKHYNRLGRASASVRGRVFQGEAYFMEKPNRNNQDVANSAMGIVVDHIEPYAHWKPSLLDAILKYGDRLYTMSLPRAKSAPHVCPGELVKQFHVTNFNVKLDIESDVVTGDIKAGDSGGVLNLKRGLTSFFQANKYGILCAKNYCVGVWTGEGGAFCMWEPHAVGPGGRASPGGACSLVLFSEVDYVADVFRNNVEALARPGVNRFTISAVKVSWEFCSSPGPVSPQGQVPDEGYECKVLTAYVETARGRTILRGTRPPDMVKFARDAVLQSSCGAVVAACMSLVRRPHLWTKRIVDEVMMLAGNLFTASLGSLGYEFRPGEDVLLPLQVLNRFVLGVNYIKYDLLSVYSGRLEQLEPTEMSVRSALERFFESHTHGILWSVPHAVAVWRAAGSPCFYMFEPHACGATGLRLDGQEDGAPCALTFSSAKLMAYAYLQNIPVSERPKHDFQLYAIHVSVQPIKSLGGVDPPLVRAPSGVKLVSATSKVYLDGSKRRAEESDRKHPPGSVTCFDAQRAAEDVDKEQNKFKGQRNTSGWLVLTDGSQYLSAQHSMACKKFPIGSRGNQAVACAVMAVAMSRVEEVCRWSRSTLDRILEDGDQLYQDSYLHFRPKGTKLLGIEQILRKFYTPGNCVCRVVVYKPRQQGEVTADLLAELGQFFREEHAGVLVANGGEDAVALFRTPRGYYMFDAADRDRYGRAVAPPCIGRARACLSQYPSIKMLADKLGPNIPPVTDASADTTTNETAGEKEVRFEKPKETPATFRIYGMDVTSLRRLNQQEKM